MGMRRCGKLLLIVGDRWRSARAGRRRNRSRPASRPGSAPIMPPRSATGGRWPKRRCRRRVQSRPGLSPRPRRAGQPRRRPDLVRARRAQGPCRRPDDARPAAVPERRPGRRPALAESRRRARRAARAADLRHRLVQRRRRHRRTRCSAYAYVSRAAAQGLAPAKATLAELDQILPLDMRQKGVALAMAHRPRPRGASQGRQPAKAAAEAARRRRPAKRCQARRQRRRPPPAEGNWRVQLGAFAKRVVGRSLVHQTVGSGALAGRQPYLCRRRRGHPAAGRAVRQPRRGGGGLRALVGARPGLLPGRGEIRLSR